MLRETSVWAMTLEAGHGGQAGAEAGEGVVAENFRLRGQGAKEQSHLGRKSWELDDFLHDWRTQHVK